MELILFKEIDIQRPRGKDLADLRQKICVFDFAMGVDVDDGDLVLYGYGGWPLGVRLVVGRGRRGDEGAGTLRGEDILDADWNGRETLLYGEMMDYFGAIEAGGNVSRALYEDGIDVR